MRKVKVKPEIPAVSMPNIPTHIVRVLKVGSCTNLSGKHTLTYHIGCDEEATIYFRVYENSGSGYYSTEWVPLAAMLNAIENGPTPTTSYALYPLFKGKSVNTPAFLLAALLNEGLMQIHPEQQRCYVSTDSVPFMLEIKQLITSNINIEITPLAKKKHQRVALIEAGPVNTHHKIKTK